MQHAAPSEVRYPYCDREGTLLFEVVRHYPKRFEVVDPRRGVLADGVLPAYVLYRLPELRSAEPGVTVWYVEGEKDAETLRAAGLVATTNPGGCRHGWRGDYAEDLRGRHVVIVPDADGPGQRLGDAVAEGVRGIAASVVLLRLPIQGRDDVSDWLARRGNIPRLMDLTVKARFEAAGVQGKPDKRDLIFRSRLPTLSKLLLLALLHGSRHDGAAKVDRCRATAHELAARCGCHRVTAQRTLTDLLRGGVLHRVEEDMTFAWDILAVLTVDPLRAVRLAHT